MEETRWEELPLAISPRRHHLSEKLQAEPVKSAAKPAPRPNAPAKKTIAIQDLDQTVPVSVLPRRPVRPASQAKRNQMSKRSQPPRTRNTVSLHLEGCRIRAYAKAGKGVGRLTC